MEIVKMAPLVFQHLKLLIETRSATQTLVSISSEVKSNCTTYKMRDQRVRKVASGHRCKRLNKTCRAINVLLWVGKVLLLAMISQWQQIMYQDKWSPKRPRLPMAQMEETIRGLKASTIHLCIRTQNKLSYQRLLTRKARRTWDPSLEVFKNLWSMAIDLALQTHSTTCPCLIKSVAIIQPACKDLQVPSISNSKTSTQWSPWATKCNTTRLSTACRFITN